MQAFEFGDVPFADLEKANFTPVLEDENFDFQVTNPRMLNGHIVYHVRGVDRQGPWEGQRRYNEFHVLNQVMLARWPAMLIPKLPPKKAIVTNELS